MGDLDKSKRRKIEALAGILGWREATAVVRPPGAPIWLRVNAADWEQLVYGEALH